MRVQRFTIAAAMTIIPLFAQNQLDYLALGDSIPFGLDPTLLTQPKVKPSDFTGYPEILNSAIPLIKNEINASCPGETSGSFLNTAAPDNGCNHEHVEIGQPTLPAFKTSIGLHTPYTGAQVDFAVSQLTSNPKIKLVTLSLGANDLLLLQLRCATAPDFAACVLPLLQNEVLPNFGMNLTQILTAIRVRAHYTGTLVVMTYYSPRADPVFVQAVSALNQVMYLVGAQFGARFADGFTAFRLASTFFQGDPCKAGLLIRLSATSCDVHPSRLGQSILAGTVVLNIGK